MWMIAKNGSVVNMSMMECLCINRMDNRQVVAISPSGKTYIMAERAAPEDAVRFLKKAAVAMNRIMENRNGT